jgi:predicted RNA binding protein YcfA (HicA-like mRNA interferase family)
MHQLGGIIISSFDKLNDRVRSIPNDLSIDDADKFLRHYGYVKARQKGSHCIYKRPGSRLINIQGPIVEEYQIRQIIDAVDSFI